MIIPSDLAPSPGPEVICPGKQLPQKPAPRFSLSSRLLSHMVSPLPVADESGLLPPSARVMFSCAGQIQPLPGWIIPGENPLETPNLY